MLSSPHLPPCLLLESFCHPIPHSIICYYNLSIFITPFDCRACTFHHSVLLHLLSHNKMASSGPRPLGPLSAGSGQEMLTQSMSLLGLPAYIITSFFPGLLEALARYPKAIRALSLPLALWFISSFAAGKLMSVWHYLMTNCMSSVTISADDHKLLSTLRRFMTEKRLLLTESDKSAQSAEHFQHQANSFGRGYMRQLLANEIIKYEPLNKLQAFRHDSRFYFITKDTISGRKENLPTGELKVWCFGWSPEPIQELLEKAYSAQKTVESHTSVNINAPNHGQQWTRRCVKAIRPLDTVCLDQEQKNQIIGDINEYISPATSEWYSERGIPYRRGYLFHG